MTSSIPLGGKGEPVKSLAAQYPDMRRFIREGYVRYAFTRFGVPYVVSIQCLDSAPRPRRLACREAYPVAERFLKALRIAGGLPSRPRMDIASEIAERPVGAIRRVHLSPGRRHPRQQRLSQSERPGRSRRLFADPLSAGRRLPSCIRNPSASAARPTNSRPAEQHQLSLAGQFLRGAQLWRRPMRRAASAIRARTSARAPVPPTTKAPIAAIPSSSRSSRSATAS